MWAEYASYSSATQRSTSGPILTSRLNECLIVVMLNVILFPLSPVNYGWKCLFISVIKRRQWPHSSSWEEASPVVAVVSVPLGHDLKLKTSRRAGKINIVNTSYLVYNRTIQLFTEWHGLLTFIAQIPVNDQWTMTPPAAEIYAVGINDRWRALNTKLTSF